MLTSLATLIEPVVDTCADLLRHGFARRDDLPTVELKSDNSPVTICDKEASRIIVEHLSKTYPDIPVISEEAELPTTRQRLAWGRLFLVDPLDGTKEFIRGSPDFTINIAYIENGDPVWGIVCAPMHNLKIYGGHTVGAHYKRGNSALWTKLGSPVPSLAQGLRGVMSQGHTDPLESPLAKSLQLRQVERFGSSYKFMKLAMGEADIFFRKTPTYEWDTAAGHAMLRGLGFCTLNFAGAEFRYNVRNTLLNGEFLCAHTSIIDHCLKLIQNKQNSL